MSKLKSHKNQKCVKRNFFFIILFIYIFIEFIEHTIGFVRLTLMPTPTRAEKGIQSVLLFSAAELKQSVLTIRLRRHLPNWNNEK